MHYKLYIDSVFILQMTTNLYLLSLTGQVLRRTATRRRIWLGAAAGAGISCVFLALPILTAGTRLLLGTLPASMCMMCLCYRIYGTRRLLEASVMMAAAGFFWGGAMIWILNRLRNATKGRGGLFLTLTGGVLSYLVLEGVLKRVMKRSASCLRTVRFYVPGLGQEIRVKAFVDTGNHLADPINGAPVSIISERAARCMESCFLQERYHAIPFRSVGKESGILSAYELPKMVIEEEGREVEREHVIVAVCDAGISPKSDYQMILHPGLLENQEEEKWF